MSSDLLRALDCDLERWLCCGALCDVQHMDTATVRNAFMELVESVQTLTEQRDALLTGLREAAIELEHAGAIHAAERARARLAEVE